MREYDNPFYRNFIFTDADAKRCTIKWWHYPILWFKPTYCQISENYVFCYKQTSDGRIWITDMWPVPDWPEPPPTTEER